MIPPTCSAAFIIHAKYSVHNIIASVTGIRNGSGTERTTGRVRARERREGGGLSKQASKTTVLSCKTKYENVEEFPLYPFIFVHFQLDLF